MTTTDTLFDRSPAATRAAPAPRHDVYGNIHKALRAMMFDTLQRVGTLDVTDDDDMARTLGQAERLLAHLTSHLEHEDEFVHPALEACSPGASVVTADAHAEHRGSIAALAAEISALRSAAAAERSLRSARLYRHLALFVADNLQHMHIEETAHNTLLWAACTDAELQALTGRIVAHLQPQIMAEALDWMAASLNPAELAELFGGIQLQAPPEAFRSLLEIARSRLDDKRWARLARALGLPPAPGQTTV